jgi:hypothetical protein
MRIAFTKKLSAQEVQLLLDLVLRRIFGPKRMEVKGSWRKLLFAK